MVEGIPEQECEQGGGTTGLERGLKAIAVAQLPEKSMHSVTRKLTDRVEMSARESLTTKVQESRGGSVGRKTQLSTEPFTMAN